MTKKRRITWYVEPLDADTNERMVKFLLSIDQLIEQPNMPYDETPGLSVFEIPSYSIITRFYRDMRELNLKFRVFYRQNNYGSLKFWAFGKK